MAMAISIANYNYLNADKNTFSFSFPSYVDIYVLVNCKVIHMD